MLDGNSTWAASESDWKARVRMGLAGRFDAIAEAVFGTREAQALHFDLVKQGPRALSLRVRLENHSIFLKIFDGSAPDLQDAYLRERNSLLCYSHTGLVPRLLGFDDGARFVATEYEAAPTLSRLAETVPPAELGRRLGTWIAKLNAAAPARPATGNWLGYLRKYGDRLAISDVPGLEEALSRVPLCGLSLSRGDPALHNYIAGPGDRLLGVDFEEARLRPHGWDFMMATHALMVRYGREAQSRPALEAFRAAFHTHHRGALVTEELTSVAHALYIARALARGGGEGGGQWQLKHSPSGSRTGRRMWTAAITSRATRMTTRSSPSPMTALPAATSCSSSGARARPRKRARAPAATMCS
ncbi:MAG: hypothetical protein RIG84_20385 [Roseovarius sp.]